MLKQYSKIEERNPGKFPARRLLMSWNRSSTQGGKWGSTKRLSIIKVFLPEMDLPSLEVGRSRLFDFAPANILLPADLHHLESLAGYSFRKKSLLVQSISHSLNATATASYERLEFLGDAILEVIVVTELMTYENELSHSLMHLYEITLVNGD
jgi:dsRNA-specific ribonuclease